MIGFWTDERIEVLTNLYAEGFSCRAIGLTIGASRNAIIGKVHRLGLPAPAHKKTVTKKKRARRSSETHGNIITRIVRANGNSNQMRVMAAIERAQYKLRCIEIEPLNKSLLDLERDECRYAFGDGPFLFCGHPVREGTSYCAPHHALCTELPRVLTDKAPLREAA